MIFDLTNSFIDACGFKMKETQIQKVLESRFLDSSIEISNISFTPRDFLISYDLIILASRDADIEFC